jgi:hypothetical protein
MNAKQQIKSIISMMAVAILVTAIVVLIPYGCTRPDQAIRVLEAAGYKDIRITGWRPFMAGKDDAFSTGFMAKGPNGAVVTGAVTSSWLKGATIRLD